MKPFSQRFQANIYKDNFSEELLSKSTRQAIRTARDKVYSSPFGGSELFGRFLYFDEKSRKSSKKYPSAWSDLLSKTLLDTYLRAVYITLTIINLNERLENLPKLHKIQG